MIKKLLLTIGVTVLATACTDDYQATAGASGKATFDAACVNCHKPLEDNADKHFELTADKRNVAYVSEKVTSGSLRMPKFPNVQGAELAALSEYVVAHSVKAE